MVKYALILAFSYPCVSEHNLLSSLPCALHDIKMIYKLCSSMGLDDSNITLVTDVNKLPNDVLNCNIKRNAYPSDTFVCREICQFLENTIRGIEELTYKDDTDFPEVLFYISGHGSEINIDGNNEQSIVLYSEDTSHLKYLLSKDIFNIMFGNIPINVYGRMEVPVLISSKSYRKIETTTEIKYIPEKIGIKSPIVIQLTPPIISPGNSPDMITKPYRSTYLANRGIPISTRMLIIIDTCYSEHMTYFPYIYDHRLQTMVETNNSNIEVSSILPYCVTISSCESNKKSGAQSSGSSLTKILYIKLAKFRGRLNISQLHYIIYNSDNNIINDLIKNESSHPIITSTHKNSDNEIPFFSNFKIKKPVRIEK